MNIVLTGGTGFIGSHLIPELIKIGHKVILLKRHNSSLKKIEYLLPKLEVQDIGDYDNFGKIFEKYQIDGIIHLATYYIKNHSSWQDIVAMNDANITCFSLLLEAAVHRRIKFFINTGTCFEYKLSRNKLDEKSKEEAYNYYASTKLAFEKVLQYYSAHHPIKALTLRLFYPYGERDKPKLIQIILSSILKDKPISLTLGEQQLNYTYVEDIVEAYILGLNYISKQKKSYELINIGTDQITTIKNIVHILEAIAKKKAPISFDKPYPAHEIMYMNADNRKAKKLLGWVPKHTIQQGLKKIYNYYINHLEELP